MNAGQNVRSTHSLPMRREHWPLGSALLDEKQFLRLSADGLLAFRQELEVNQQARVLLLLWQEVIYTRTECNSAAHELAQLTKRTKAFNHLVYSIL